MEDLYKKRGLVLGGGGAKGCYEIGVCQALQENGYKFDVVTGTSIGALVGSMVAQNNLEPLVDFVYNLSPDKVMEGFFDLPDNAKALFSEIGRINRFINKTVEEKGTDITPLREAFKDMFNYRRFMNSGIHYGCMTYNVKRFEGKAWTKEDMTEENVHDIILASATCFPAMPMIRINGEDYIDGGYCDNVPIQLAIDLGATDILAVRLRAPGLFHDRTYSGAKVCIIEPILELGNFLDFDNEKGKRSLRTGYLEMMKHLNRFAGYFYTFAKEDEEEIRKFEKYAQTLNFPYEKQRSLIDEMYKSSFGYIPPAFTFKFKEKYFYWAFLECLAFKHQIDPVNLYSVKNFWTAILEKGPYKKESSSLIKNFMEDKDVIGETYDFIYRALVHYIMNAKEED